MVGGTNASTGWTFGVQGITSSSTDFSAGVVGVVNAQTSGLGVGVLGFSSSPTQTAGVFWDFSGTGHVLSGRSGCPTAGCTENNPIGPFPEVFAVQSTGDVISRTGDFQALAAGKGLILKSPDGTKCARLSLDNTPALVTTVVTCPQ
jgi:hypothetical protein